MTHSNLFIVDNPNKSAMLNFSINLKSFESNANADNKPCMIWGGGGGAHRICMVFHALTAGWICLHWPFDCRMLCSFYCSFIVLLTILCFA